MSLETDVRYLLDPIEIQDVIAKYGIVQDLHQANQDDNVLDHWSDVFAPDAVSIPPTSAKPELWTYVHTENLRAATWTEAA